MGGRTRIPGLDPYRRMYRLDPTDEWVELSSQFIGHMFKILTIPLEYYKESNWLKSGLKSGTNFKVGSPSNTAKFDRKWKTSRGIVYPHDVFLADPRHLDQNNAC